MVIFDEEEQHVVEVLEEEIDQEVPSEGLVAKEGFVVLGEFVGFCVLGEVGCQLAEHL